MKIIAVLMLILSATLASTKVSIPGSVDSAHAETKAEVATDNFTTYCSACHSLNPPPKLAPPVRGIVMNYARAGSDRETFIQQVRDFAKNPSHQAAKLPQAIDNFGLMPALPLSDQILESIAAQMWDNIKGKDATNFSPQERALAIGQELSTRLMKGVRAELEEAIKSGSIVSALEACSEKAPKIAEQINQQQKEGVLVSRVSDKPRNPNNAADRMDLEAIEFYRSTKSTEPKLYAGNNNATIFYRPLYLEAMCLSCHGLGSTFSPELKAELQKRYPQDQAINYAQGDLRGLVKVEIPEAACEN